MVARCKINPSGFQWFDLSIDDEKLYSKSVIKSEIRINNFLSEIKNEYKLTNSDICLSGFSQRCMMAINVALTSKIPFNCLVGFSGKNNKQKIYRKDKFQALKFC